MKEDIKLFNDYYDRFDHSEYGIYYKYDHTFRVIDIAEEIAKSLNLNEEDLLLAKRCALYHDIARFSQWTEYKTFKDYFSFDHGKEGVTILKELDINDDIILQSTYYHNKFEVDPSLDDRTKLFCNITRDADKIDILENHIINFTDNEIVLDNNIMNTFKEHKTIKYSDVNRDLSLHNILICIAYIFDINYKKSFELLKEKDVINTKFNIILSKFDDDRVKELQNICNKYIEERISD